jgi:prepilin signal peptidase PulO-like enzyme (type II secretory pathway)
MSYTRSNPGFFGRCPFCNSKTFPLKSTQRSPSSCCRHCDRQLQPRVNYVLIGVIVGLLQLAHQLVAGRLDWYPLTSNATHDAFLFLGFAVTGVLVAWLFGFVPRR